MYGQAVSNAESYRNAKFHIRLTICVHFVLLTMVKISIRHSLLFMIVSLSVGIYKIIFLKPSFTKLDFKSTKYYSSFEYRCEFLFKPFVFGYV